MSLPTADQEPPLPGHEEPVPGGEADDQAEERRVGGDEPGPQPAPVHGEDEEPEETDGDGDAEGERGARAPARLGTRPLQ